MTSEEPLPDDPAMVDVTRAYYLAGLGLKALDAIDAALDGRND